jgi:hypothetical protein
VHRNRHDTWQHFCDDHRELLTATGLPAKVARAEQRFRDLLREGRAEDCGVTAALAELTGAQWAALAQFAEVFFREFESYAPLDLFPAFRREAERRGPSLAGGRRDQ